MGKQPIIISLGFRKNAGKDTAANYLVDRYGFTKLSFADVLRDAAKALFGFTDHQMSDRRLKEMPDEAWKISPRDSLKSLGDAVREKFGEEFLIRCTQNRIRDIASRIPDAKIVIADVRLFTEARAIKSWDGQLWLVNRKTEHSDQHRTETELDAFNGWDQLLDNDRSMAELFEQIDRIMEA